MKKKAYLSILSVAAIAVISAVALWKIMFEQSDIGRFGLGGIFLASMLSHMTIIARDMFVPIFLSLTNIYNPILLGAVAGWGGAIGDVTAYFLGWGVGESVRRNGENDDRLMSWIKKYGLWAVLLFSATPLSVGNLYASAFMVVLSVTFCILVSWPKSRDLIFGWVERFIL